MRNRLGRTFDTVASDLLLTDPPDVNPYEHLYEHLYELPRTAALSPDDSLDLLTKAPKAPGPRAPGTR